MRGISYFLLCTSAVALSSGVWAQAGKTATTSTEDQRLTRYRAFDLEATAAESLAAAKKAAAKQTEAFLADITDKKGQPLNQDPKLAVAVVQLSAQLKIEQAEAGTASTHATALRSKANSAMDALAALGVPMFVQPPPSPPPTKPLTPEQAAAAKQERPNGAFGRSFACLFEHPDTLTALPARSSEDGDNSQRAPQGVSNRSASAIGTTVGAFLFDREIDRRTSGVSLDLSSEDSRLGVQFAIPQAGKFIGRSAGPSGGCGENAPIVEDSPYLNTYSFGISAGSKEGFAEILKRGEHGGFADGFKLTFGIGKTLYRRRNIEQMMHAVRSAEAALESKCRSGLWATTPGISGEELASKCSGEALRAWALAGEPDEGVTAFTRADSRKAMLDALWGQQNPVLDFGVALDLGYRSFAYRLLDSTDPAEVDASDRFLRKVHRPDEVEWQLSGHIGTFIYRRDPTATPDTEAANYSPGKVVAYVAAVTEMGREWEFPDDTDDQVVCPLVAAGAVYTRCSTLDIAAPARDRFIRIGGQARFAFRGGRLVPKVAFSPKITVDVTNGQASYDLPITFLQSADSKFNAGLRVKGELWGDNPDQLSVGFFLGTTFNILK
jgi:hypothetical protein